jgi:hypothetical protein
MIVMKDVYARLQQRLIHECTSISTIREEINELAQAYNQYVDLRSRLTEHERRMSHLVKLLGPERFDETMKGDDTQCLREAFVTLPSPQEWRGKLRLWIAIREYLRVVVGESKLRDIQQFLGWIGLENVTRQAIESAIKQHSDHFEIIKKGHERYVKLRD